MQVTLMIPKNSSGSVSTPKDDSPISRRPSPIPRVINASNSPRHPEIDHRINSLLREISVRTMLPRSTPVPEEGVLGGYVQTQIKEIERRTPPKKEDNYTASPRPKEPTPRRDFIGITKLNSSEKRGCLLPPRPPRKDSITMPPDSPKNVPLPPIPRGKTAPGIDPSFQLVPGMELIQSKNKQLVKTNSEVKLVPHKTPPLDRGDYTSLRHIGDRISSLTNPRATRTPTKNVFSEYINSLSERLKEADGGICLRIQEQVLVTNSENTLVWIKAENESSTKNMHRGSKSTLLNILKTLKRAAKTIQNGTELESDITKNVDRLLENETVQMYYNSSGDIRSRIHALYFKVVYGKLYSDAKLIRDVLELSEYNILQMCEFLSIEQEALIKKFKDIYSEFPKNDAAIFAIMQRLNHHDLRGEMNAMEKANHVERIWDNPQALPISTPQRIDYSIHQIISNTYKACHDFRKNTIFIDNLEDYIKSMSDERREGSLLSVTLPKVQAKELLQMHQIGACISVIMTPHTRFLTTQIAIVPHAIRDIYRRTVKLLEEQGKIHKIDVAKYLDVIRFQTQVVNDQTVQWKLLSGTINEIAKYVPKKEVSLTKRSSKKVKKR